VVVVEVDVDVELGVVDDVAGPVGGGVVVVVGVPEYVGASVGVAGALCGMDVSGGAAFAGGSADIDTQVAQSTAQSQMSPSA
jgi:hypothetical protein